MKLSANSKNKPTLSLTPLIDVVFILLIFFMLVSQFARLQQQSIPLNSGVGESTDSRGMVSIFIELRNTDSVNYRIDKIDMNFTQLTKHIQKNRVAEVLLLPEADISLQTFINVKERLTNLGIKKISSEFSSHENS